MRSRSLRFFLLVVGFGVSGHAFAQSCVNLACQQQACSGNATTTITGTVYAPNGTDPLPNVTVYIPNDVVPAFTAGVTCPLVGAPQPGSPLVGAETNVNGNFTLSNVPVGSNIPLVIVSGRWRRQLVIPSITACTSNPMPPSFAVMPANALQGDIPKIAIATGAVDQVECVLRKMGIDQAEFTDPSGSGRINLYTGSASSGSAIDAATPTQASLMENAATLNSYDVLMLPCQGTPNGDVVAGPLGTQELANFVAFANAGGRVYSSHYSYAWMFNNPPFNGVANWLGAAGGGGQSPDPGTATVDVSFTGGQTLATWLQNVGASISLGQMQLNTLKHDVNGVIPPTQSWLTLNTTGNPVMQFVFDTPVATPANPAPNQCGRVLYNEYHVENGSSSPAKLFPTECTAGAMTPQEKLLEYMLFELTDEGGQASLDPTVQDFGSEAVGFPSAPFTFTWKNNSSFASQVTAVNAGGDFAVTANNCTTGAAIPGGASCQITVVFTPTILGPETGTLTVTAQGNSLTASLTGTGTAGYSLSGSTLSYGNLDVGNTVTQTLTLTNIASGTLPIPAFVTTGQYQVSTAACGASILPGKTCPVTVTFLPTVTGPLNGTLGVNSNSLLYSGLSATLTGNGVDFTLGLSPTSGSVIAGDATSTIATLTPIAGFSSPISLLCQIGAVATNCGLSTATFTPTAVTTVTVSLATTSQYTVVGYGGFGGRGYLWLVGLGTGLLLWRGRRRAGAMLRSGLAVALLAAIGLGMSGCSGKLPAQNPAYTGPGSYTVKMTATDGFLVRTATYTLTVTAK